MNNWYGRVLVVVAAAIGAIIAMPNTPTAELSRFIPIELSASIPTAAAGLPVRPGSIDQVTDAPEGLLIEGWVGRDADAITIVVEPKVEPQRQLVLLLGRPDVAASGASLFTGFRVVFPGVETTEVRCIFFEGPAGATEMWRGEDGCG